MQVARRIGPSSSGGIASLVFGILFGAIVLALVGASIAMSPKWGTILVLGAAFAFAAFSIPLRSMLYLELLLAAVFAGSMEYFLHSTQGFWVAAILPLLLAARALFQTAKPAEGFSPPLQQGRAVAFMFAGLLTYLACLGFSAILNQSPPIQVVVAAKNYLFVWLLLAVFAKEVDFGRCSDGMWRVVIWVSVLQLPVVLYQRFFIASKIGNTAAGLSWDAVSGTFGGGLTGGRSAAMTLFIVVSIAYLLIRWRDRQLTGFKALGLIALMIPAVILAEVKMVVIWLAVVAIVVFFKELRKRPIFSIFAIFTMLVLALGIVLAYNAMYYAGTYSSSTDLYNKQIGYIFDVHRFNPVTREIGRVASIYFWWTENANADLAQLLIGAGPGASRGASSLAVGEVARRYSYFLDTSTLTTLLWDGGLLAAGLFITIILSAMLVLLRAVSNVSLSLAARNQAEAAFIGLLLILSGIAYNRDAIDSFSIQTLLVFFMAAAAYWGRMRRPSAAARFSWSTDKSQADSPAGRTR